MLLQTKWLRRPQKHKRTRHPEGGVTEQFSRSCTPCFPEIHNRHSARKDIFDALYPTCRVRSDVDRSLTHAARLLASLREGQEDAENDNATSLCWKGTTFSVAQIVKRPCSLLSRFLGDKSGSVHRTRAYVRSPPSPCLFPAWLRRNWDDQTRSPYVVWELSDRAESFAFFDSPQHANPQAESGREASTRARYRPEKSSLQTKQLFIGTCTPTAASKSARRLFVARLWRPSSEVCSRSCPSCVLLTCPWRTPLSLRHRSRASGRA